MQFLNILLLFEETWHQQQQQITSVPQIISVWPNNWHLYCLQKSVCQQRYLTSVLLVSRHNRSLHCPITNTTCFSALRKHLTLNIRCYLSIWISYKTRKTIKKGIENICGTSYKTRKTTKKYSCYYIYIHVIHVRLDIALMEGDLYPLWFLKNIYQPVQLIASLL